MSYNDADDPQLRHDLVAALKRWHHPTLGRSALATRLAAVDRCLAARPNQSHTEAVRCVLHTALDQIAGSGHAGHADLLKARYLRRKTVHELAQDLSCGDRAVYYHLAEATAALAAAVWAIECAPPVPPVAQQPRPAAPAEPVGQAAALAFLPPPTYTRLFGVDRALERLVGLLSVPGAHPLISVEGMGGIGKTALTREAVARIAAAGRFAGIAWMTAKQEIFSWQGIERTDRPLLTFEEVLSHLLAQLDDSGARPVLLSAKRERARAVLASRSHLVVVDNLEAAADAEALPDWLREMAGLSTFLITGRHRVRPSGAEHARAPILSLDQLPEPDALALLRYEAALSGWQDVEGVDDDTLRPVLDVTGGHPLAIKLVAGQLGVLPLHRVLATLEIPRPGIDPFYEFLYRPSWQILSGPAREILFILALLPAGGAPWEDLAGIDGRPDTILAAALEELAARSLIQVGGVVDKTYSLHPLTRHFAAGRIPPGELAGWIRRVGDYYLTYVRRHLGDWAALDSRQEHIVLAIERCATAGSAGRRIAVDGARLFGEFIYRHGHLSVWMPRLELAAQAAGELGDSLAQAELWNQQGQFKSSEGHIADALALHGRAADVFRRHGEWLSLARTLRFQGNAHYSLADWPAALACYEQARALLPGLPGPARREMSYVCHNMAGIYTQQEDWPRALACYDEAVNCLDPAQDPPFATRLHANLGLAYREMGHWRRAVAELLWALPRQQKAGDSIGEANSRQYLCVTYGELGAWQEALAHGQQALILRRQMSSSDGLASLYTDLAFLYVHMGDLEQARACIDLAGPLWRDMQRPAELSRVWLAESELHASRRAWPEAKAACREALGLLEARPAFRSRRLTALLGWASACLEQGDTAGARALLPDIQTLADSLDRPDLRVRALWLQAALEPAQRQARLDAALALCGPLGAGNDRLDALRRQTQAMRSALEG